MFEGSEFRSKLRVPRDSAAIESYFMSPVLICLCKITNHFPGLMIVYDNIAEKWLALPKEALVLGGLAKFNIARKLAIELCLGSIGVSLCNKTIQDDSSTPEPNDIVLAYTQQNI